MNDRQDQNSPSSQGPIGVCLRVAAGGPDSDAIQRQREDCIALMQRRGINPSGAVYYVNDSAKAIADLENGAIGTLVATAPDRISRRSDDMNRLAGLVGARRMLFANPEVDTDEPEHRAALRVLLQAFNADAQQQHRNQSRRAK